MEGSIPPASLGGITWFMRSVTFENLLIGALPGTFGSEGTESCGDPLVMTAGRLSSARGAAATA